MTEVVRPDSCRWRRPLFPVAAISSNMSNQLQVNSASMDSSTGRRASAAPPPPPAVTAAAKVASSSSVGLKRAHKQLQACEGTDELQQLEAAAAAPLADGSDAEPPNKRARKQTQPQPQQEEEEHKSVHPSASVASSSLPSMACAATSSLASSASGDASGAVAAGDDVASEPLALAEQQLLESNETAPAAAIATANELKATAIVEVRRAPSHACELAFLRSIQPWLTVRRGRHPRVCAALFV